MKSYYGGPIGSHQRSFERHHPQPLPPPLPKIGGSQSYPKTAIAIAIISGTGKATDCKFGRYIHRVHPNKSPLKFPRKGSVGVSRDCPIFWVPPIISGIGKATNFKFCTHIYKLDRNKCPLKISLAVAVGVLKDSWKFSWHPYIGRIARSSLR